MTARIPFSVRRPRLEELSEANPGWQIEREADGSITMSPTGTASGARGMALAFILMRWDDMVGHGYAFGSSTGFTMPDDAILSPDAAWISADRYRALTPDERETYAPIVPDVCIEVRARSDELGALREKVRRYRAYGVRYVVLIDPYARAVWTDGEIPDGFPTDFTAVFDAGTV